MPFSVFIVDDDFRRRAMLVDLVNRLMVSARVVRAFGSEIGTAQIDEQLRQGDLCLIDANIPRTTRRGLVATAAAKQARVVYVMASQGALPRDGQPDAVDPTPLVLVATTDERSATAAIRALDPTPAVPASATESEMPALVALRASYLEKLPAKLEALREALTEARDAGTHEALARAEHLAHKLHGTAGSYGFAAVGAQAGRIEAELEAVLDGEARAENVWETVFAALDRADEAVTAT